MPDGKQPKTATDRRSERYRRDEILFAHIDAALAANALALQKDPKPALAL